MPCTTPVRSASRAARTVPTAMLALLVVTTAVAQELSPRAYWPAPTGTKIAILGYAFSAGDILMDPTLPVVGVDSRTSVGLAAYNQVFGLAGRTASVLVQLPYSWGTTEGELAGEFRRRELSGLADLRARFAINIKGAPSMDVLQFQEFRLDPPKMVLGLSFELQAPTGEYEPDKLLNLSSNRWAIKSELGLAAPFRRHWVAEVAVGAWIFGDDDEFLETSTREQESILATEFHLVRRIKPGFWASLDLNFYYGGRNIIDGQRGAALQRNSRLGATAVFPFRRQHALKLSYSTGIVTETGGDWEKVLVSYLYAWRSRT